MPVIKKYPLPHTYTSSGWQTQDTELQTRLAGRSAYFEGRKREKKFLEKKGMPQMVFQEHYYIFSVVFSDGESL